MEKIGIEIHGYAATLVYLHIPKTAGQSLLATLERIYTVFGMYKIYPLAYVSEDEELPTETPRLIVGHFSYGLPCRIFGNIPFRWVTFLRNPSARLISQYRFDCDYFFASELANDEANRNLIFSVPPGEFIKRSRLWTYDNCMTRMLSGVGGTVPFGEMDRSILEMAKNNLSRFFFVGFQENFKAGTEKLAEKCGFPYFNVGHKNVSREENVIKEFDINELSELSNLNVFDFELYYWAAERFLDLRKNVVINDE